MQSSTGNYYSDREPVLSPISIPRARGIEEGSSLFVESRATVDVGLPRSCNNLHTNKYRYGHEGFLLREFHVG